MNLGPHPDQVRFRERLDYLYGMYIAPLRVRLPRNQARERRTPLFGTRMDNYRQMLQDTVETLTEYLNAYRDRPHERRRIEALVRDALQVIRELKRELRFHPNLANHRLFQEYEERIRTHWNTLQADWYRHG